MKNPTSRTKDRQARSRSNAEWTADTRRRLIAAGRRLFAERGFAAVGTAEIGARAGLTRGALHYQFADKRGLFAAVLEQLLRELVAELARDTMEGIEEGTAELERGALLLLEAYGRPELQRLLLLDAPQVLGWSEWLALQERSGLAALLDHALDHWVETGWVERARVSATRRLLFGALVHAGSAIAEAGDRSAALASFREPLRRLIRGLARPTRAHPGSRGKMRPRSLEE
jgi:AcrR family transcriptional regulator